MGGRRRGRSNRAYGVAVTFLPQKGGAVPESERRRAAWRTTEPSHTCLCSSFAVPSPPLFPAWAGQRVGARCGVACECVRLQRRTAQGTIGFVLLTTKALSKKKKQT